MKLLNPILSGLALTLAMTAPATAQQYTTAAEVRPMLDVTKARWIAVREYDGKDLLYFTNLLAWRCGLDAIHFSVNGGAETRYDAEPCYDGEAVPNAQKELPYVSFPIGSVNAVSVRVTYDDGKTDKADYQRGDILTP